jgi:hypothetical protein
MSLKEVLCFAAASPVIGIRFPIPSWQEVVDRLPYLCQDLQLFLQLGAFADWERRAILLADAFKTLLRVLPTSKTLFNAWLERNDFLFTAGLKAAEFLGLVDPVLARFYKDLYFDDWVELHGSKVKKMYHLRDLLKMPLSQLTEILLKDGFEEKEVFEILLLVALLRASL